VTPVVRQLLLANVVVYLLVPRGSELFFNLWLYPPLMLSRPWTPFTYMFLHGGFMHLLFNMIALFFFGPQLEARLGSRHFLGLYMLSGVMGAVASLIPPYAPIVGASGAVFGVLLGYATFWPRRQILIWGIVPVEARIFVIFLTLLSLVSGFGGAGGGIAHFAHLGGFLGGWLYLRVRQRTSAATRFQKRAESPGVKMGDRQILEQWKRIRPEELHEVNREEYERIAEKIRTQGPSSLTDRERTFVGRFSRGTAAAPG
jgi:membrane associated rhomboid family serine protease